MQLSGPLTPGQQQIDRGEYHDDRDIADQPRQQVMSQEQNVHTDYDRHHRDHVKSGSCLSSHWFVLLCESLSSKPRARRASPVSGADPPVYSSSTVKVKIR